jgi:hypothetical protein
VGDDAAEGCLGRKPGRLCRENVGMPGFLVSEGNDCYTNSPGCASNFSLQKPKAFHYPSFGRAARLGGAYPLGTSELLILYESDFKETRSTSVSVMSALMQT